MVWGPGGLAKSPYVDQPVAARGERVARRPIELGTPVRPTYPGAAPVLMATAGGAEASRGASGVMVSQAIAVPANATGSSSQITVVGAARRSAEAALARGNATDDRVIVRTDQLFRAFGKGRYRNFGYSELLEPRQVGPFVGTPIFGPLGPGDGQPVTPPRQTQAEIDRAKQERIYQMFESLRPVEDRFPLPVGR